MKLYHATTEKKAKLYRQCGEIHNPVRGFDTLSGAMAWAMKVGRKVILEIDCPKDDIVHKLPDHHNKFGVAYWYEENVNSWKCVLSADTEA